MRRIPLLLLFLMIPMIAVVAAPPLGSTLPEVVLEGDDGGRVNGEPWSSAELRGRVHYVFYVDPDVSDINEEMQDELDAQDFPEEKAKSVAIINMAATWMPNFAVSVLLKRNQKKYPNVVYVEDLERILVKKWGLKDETYVAVVLDPEGKVIYTYDGKMPMSATKEMIEIIRANLP